MKESSIEMDAGAGYTGYHEACEIIAANVRPAGREDLRLDLCAGRVAAADITAALSYPSNDVSLKDGFAVKSPDVASASKENPVRLRITGSAFAGDIYTEQLTAGCAVKICSGSAIPPGADAVVASEFCNESSHGDVSVKADAYAGRNIMRAGSEVEAGSAVARRGDMLTPGMLGLAAAAGISHISVYRKPRVAIISIGDEVVAPGEKLNAGQLYASNMVTMQAWLASRLVPCVTSVVSDSRAAISREISMRLHGTDMILTSGGAWGSERDLVVGALDSLKWNKLFHYVRMGPGKGTAFGLLENVPVFCLPGGPSSNGMAFLQLALPAILRMSGDSSRPLRTVNARLTEDVRGRHHAWTEFRDAVVTTDGSGCYSAAVYKNRSRMRAIAGAGGLICIPEGRESLNCGEIVPVQLLF